MYIWPVYNEGVTLCTASDGGIYHQPWGLQPVIVMENNLNRMGDNPCAMGGCLGSILAPWWVHLKAAPAILGIWSFWRVAKSAKRQFRNPTEAALKDAMRSLGHARSVLAILAPWGAVLAASLRQAAPAILGIWGFWRVAKRCQTAVSKPHRSSFEGCNAEPGHARSVLAASWGAVLAASLRHGWFNWKLRRVILGIWGFWRVVKRCSFETL